MTNKCAITIAVGKPYYLYLARNLIYSFLLWNKNTEIYFQLLTDNASYFKEFASNPQIRIVLINLDESEKSFSSKFLLFDYSIAKENLFLDCDCLIYQNLSYVFKRMSSSDFTAIGQNVTEGNFFCDVPDTIKHFDLISLPKFVGAVYYFKNNAIAQNIFNEAKELKKKYDERGFIRLRGKENEEPLLAVAMSKNGQKPVSDDGSIKGDRMFYEKIDSNVLTGHAFLYSKLKPVKPEYCVRLNCMPAVVHYNDSFSETNHYRSEVYRLKNQHLPVWLFESFIALKYKFPDFIITKLKNKFRPVFHFLYGPLTIRKNNRV